MRESEAIEEISRLAAFWPGTSPVTIAAYASEVIDADVSDLRVARHAVVETWRRDRLPPVALVRDHIAIAKAERERDADAWRLPPPGARYRVEDPDPPGPYMPDGWIPPEPHLAKWHDQDPDGPPGTKRNQGRYLTRAEWDRRLELLRQGLASGLRGQALLAHTRHGLPE